MIDVVSTFPVIKNMLIAGIMGIFHITILGLKRKSGNFASDSGRPARSVAENRNESLGKP